MSRVELTAFAEEHLDEAGALLARRHERHRAQEPLLPRRFEDPPAAREEVELAWRDEGASGSAAVRNGRLAGYLIGAPRDDAVWGANVWVGAAAHAAEDPELIRDLYAAAAERWVESGRTRHYALVPADDALVDAWFRLSFGQQHAYGIREVPEARTAGRSDGLVVRHPEEGDLDALVEISLALPEHQQGTPVFAPGRGMPSREAERAEWIEALEGSPGADFVAEYQGRLAGAMYVAPVEESGMHRGVARPERACILAFASTLPTFRGAGVGVALTDAVFAWAREQRYTTIVTDWRVTNLLSSRFWPRRGFRTSFLRLYRSIP